MYFLAQELDQLPEGEMAEYGSPARTFDTSRVAADIKPKILALNDSGLINGEV